MKDVQKKRQPGAQKRRPGGGPRPNKFKGGKPKNFNAKKRKPEAPPAAAAAPAAKKPTGDTDDFEYMLDQLEDYKPPRDEADISDGDGAGPAGGGGSDDDDAPQQQQQEQEQGEGKKAKKRQRKKGQKLSALEFEASRQMAKQIAECSAEEQADWLWASYQQQAAASSLERGGLTAAGMAPLPAEGTLEQRLKALAPATWQQDFCGRGGSSAGGSQQQAAAAQQQQQRPAGSPSMLLVSASAMGAINLIKLTPQFNKACRIGKLFAKHMKVHEQEEALRSQVMCIAAGTPNRLCKLADGGALRLDRLKHVVIDVQLDVKQRDILAIPETRADWWQFYERQLKALVDAGTTKLSLVNSDHLGGAGS